MMIDSRTLENIGRLIVDSIKTRCIPFRKNIMFNKAFTNNIFEKTLIMLSTICIGLLLGLNALFLPPSWALGIPITILVIITTIKHPSIGILGVLFFLCTVIPEESVPIINIGPGRLLITELIVLAMFLFIIIRWLVERDFHFSTSPLNLPILLFYIWALSATIRALLWTDLTISESIPEIRIVSYYMVFYLVTNLIKNKSELEFFIRGFFLLATGVAITMIVQFIIGTKIPFLPGRVEVLVTGQESYGNITRIFDTPGESIITVCLIIKSIELFTSKLTISKGFQVIQWALLGTAMVLTFSRTHWLIVVLAFALAFLLTRKQDKRNFINWSYFLLFSVPLIILLIIAFPDSQAASLLNASADRFTSVLTVETYTGSSDTSTLRWRDFEYKYAVPQILQHPIFGLGLGAIYRPPVYGIDDAWTNLQRYIHNSQLWIVVKTGLVGYFFLAWFSIVFLWRGFKNWRKISDPHKRGFFLGTTLSYVGILVASNIHPVFTVLFWTPIIGVIMGLNEVIIKEYLPN